MRHQGAVVGGPIALTRQPGPAVRDLGAGGSATGRGAGFCRLSHALLCACPLPGRTCGVFRQRRPRPDDCSRPTDRHVVAVQTQGLPGACLTLADGLGEPAGLPLGPHLPPQGLPEDEGFGLLPEVVEVAEAAAQVPAAVISQALDIARLGGPDTTEPKWRGRAACTGSVANFFPTRGEPVQGALSTCGTCPVQACCLASAIVHGDQSGIWGGTTGARRKALRSVLRHAGILGLRGEDLYVAWSEGSSEVLLSNKEKAGTSLVPARMSPWPHQRRAVSAIVGALDNGPVCQIAMCTASGKTAVAIWAAEQMRASTVAVLVPSLSLVDQFIDMWAAQGCAARPLLVAVCSDSASTEADLVTTAPDEVARVVASSRRSGGTIVVVATYQSSRVLSSSGVVFDLVVADEAHHLAGEAGKPFAAALRGEIAARARLYMTATPKKWEARRGEIELVGMDDAEFGPRVFEFRLEDAIACGVVADYRVVVAAVDDGTFARVASHLCAGTGDQAVDPYLLAGAIAVVRLMGDYELSSCLSFHSRVERAKQFAHLVGQVAEQLVTERPAGPGWSGWLHAGTTARIRDHLLSGLADQSTWGVLANVRALGEGIDVPELDAIAIVDQKSSEVDVAQAVGRALRRPGTRRGRPKVGTVILPVLLGKPTVDDPLGAIDPHSLEVVSGVLRALRSHDPGLGSHLDGARRSIAGGAAAPGHGEWARRRAALALLRSRVDLQVPGGAMGDMAGAMALGLVREASADWEEHFGQLLDWASHHGTAQVHRSVKVATGHGGSYGLGQWCTQQRSLRRKGLLALERCKALEALPGWSWEPRDAQWAEQLAAITEWAARHGDASPPQRTVFLGLPLGRVINVLRRSYKAGELTGEKISALEEVPGWSWDQRDDTWELRFSQLEKYVAANGHACPSHGDLVDGFDVGRWTSKQRVILRSGAASPGRAARLRALPGWADHVRDAAWEQGYAHLRRWAGRPQGRPPQSTVCDDGFHLGAWVAKQRARRDVLTPERAERLESVPGWLWAPRQESDQWAEMFAKLSQWALATGRASPSKPYGHGPGAGDERQLANWAVQQRTMHKKGLLNVQRTAALESLPGWVWDVYEARFAEGITALATFARREGHGNVPQDWYEDGFPLGNWAHNTKKRARSGALPEHRLAMIEAAMPGWPEDGRPGS